MIQQVQQMNKAMSDKQEAMRQDILRRRQEEQDYKDEVLRLLNEINSKLSVDTDDEFEDVRQMFYNFNNLYGDHG